MQSLQKTEFHVDSQTYYRKLFPELKPLYLEEDRLRELTHMMEEYQRDCTDSDSIVNGLAFFGQFLAHDLTFESTSKFRTYKDPGSFLNERTLNLDLDCLYGQWTEDFLYDARDRNKMLLGEIYRDKDHEWYDLQRNAQEKAIIPDARNDENLIVSRIHLLWIEFHNCMVELTKSHSYDKNIFAEARKKVIWHYHWIILHEFLEAIMLPEIYEEIMNFGSKFYKHSSFMPLEFAGAAFRFGHSMIRDINQINDDLQKDLFTLGAFKKIEEYVDWSYFFDLGDGKMEFCKKIDTKITGGMHNIPFIPTDNKYERSLPYRNMKRGEVYQLPSGEDVAKRLGFKPIEVKECKKIHMKGTPLWFYILKEAEELCDGESLGPVGSTLVGEIIYTIIHCDKNSYTVQHPKWEPELGDTKGVFGFAEMIQWVKNCNEPEKKKKDNY